MHPLCNQRYTFCTREMGRYLHPQQFLPGVRSKCDVTGVTALFHAAFGVTGAAVTDVTAPAVYGLKIFASPAPSSIWGARACNSLRLSILIASLLPNG